MLLRVKRIHVQKCLQEDWQWGKFTCEYWFSIISSINFVFYRKENLEQLGQMVTL